MSGGARSAGSFLGRGWAFPPSFADSGADVDMVEDAEDIHQSLQILLDTSPGERVMDESFGCDLDSLRFGEMDQSFINTMERLIKKAIVSYEPRIRVDKIDVGRSQKESATVVVKLSYTVLATNSRFNMVFPFYLSEATRRGA